LVGLESMGIPLPGETVLIVAAAYAGSQEINIAGVIAAAAAGAIIGDNIGYSVGRELGFRILLRFGKYIGLNEGRIKLGQYLFMRHGAKIVFFGRFVAVLRFLAAFPAGVNRMTWPRFLAANAAGGILWATAVGTAAYTAGEGIHRVEGPLGMAVLALAVIILIWSSIRLRRNEAALQADAERALPGPLKGSGRAQ
jgi:membrane protein DedA with SNARE-associated domain